jgi:hypothetical protein
MITRPTIALFCANELLKHLDVSPAIEFRRKPAWFEAVPKDKDPRFSEVTYMSRAERRHPGFHLGLFETLVDVDVEEVLAKLTKD